MPYMIYQQLITAIKTAYAGDPAVADMAAQAKSYQDWLASLEIDPKLRDPMVEQIAALQEAFEDLAK